MLLADDRDLRVPSWLVQSSFPFPLCVDFPVSPGQAALHHGMYARWNDMATHVDDNDHEFPVI